MWRRELLKNKLYAIAIIFLGALSVPIEWDATFFLFTLMVGVTLFFFKRKLDYVGGGFMGRAERRKAERRNRIENRKGKILMSREEIGEMKQKVSSNISAYNVESLMTCFALAEHRLYGFGQKRIMRSLQYIDDLMGAIINDEVVMEDYMKELEDETGVIIKCGN